MKEEEKVTTATAGTKRPSEEVGADPDSGPKKSCTVTEHGRLWLSGNNY